MKLKIIVLTHFDPMNPPPPGYILLESYGSRLSDRFGNASGEDCIHDLRVHPKWVQNEMRLISSTLLYFSEEGLAAGGEHFLKTTFRY